MVLFKSTKDRFSFFKPYLLVLPALGFDVSLNEKGDEFLYVIEKGGRVWGMAGCDGNNCVIWLDDDSANPLVDVCFARKDDSCEGRVDVLSLLKAEDFSPDKARATGVRPAVFDYVCAVDCNECNKCVSFALIPKLLGMEHVNEVDGRLIAITAYVLVAVAYLFASILEIEKGD